MKRVASLALVLSALASACIAQTGEDGASGTQTTATPVGAAASAGPQIDPQPLPWTPGPVSTGQATGSAATAGPQPGPGAQGHGGTTNPTPIYLQ